MTLPHAFFLLFPPLFDAVQELKRRRPTLAVVTVEYFSMREQKWYPQESLAKTRFSAKLSFATTCFSSSQVPPSSSLPCCPSKVLPASSSLFSSFTSDNASCLVVGLGDHNLLAIRCLSSHLSCPVLSYPSPLLSSHASQRLFHPSLCHLDNPRGRRPPRASETFRALLPALA